MPIPPRIGVGASCQRSADGHARRAAAPRGERSSAQITTAAAGRATIATAVLTGAEGNGTPLARCYGRYRARPAGRRRAVRRSGLGTAVRQRAPVDDGGRTARHCAIGAKDTLRGGYRASAVSGTGGASGGGCVAPDALGRATARPSRDGGVKARERLPTLRRMAVYADLVRYRELFANLFRRDFQAKYRGSVLGIALVARQPARADGRLPRRLRPAARDQRRRSRTTRSTCSPGIACWIFFARLAADGGALDGRQRRADQEGALPAPARRLLGRRDTGRHVRGDARDPDRPLARLHPGARGDGLARRSRSRRSSSRSSPASRCSSRA